MPRHRSLNLKKFIDSIPEPLVAQGKDAELQSIATGKGG